ncbi:hypothetical protein EF847_12975 [Actinobacteria bacterium YIM 96077]|uniref:Uncharacterized protein n=1 Tax=Phytoactinopolyspora halophila TaxID=1981511 RepID=A0A329QHS9_9ACTN|nr:hypothetical protein [Phytoactinopolyspora halophila]AYY13469.1 hypothetical protein EF847_12975 [Actinobacteria bacterium YIM 96077]RAW10862.1 hypothetical protein DPM12_18355 [Phytoactinopolyspora halophila]
MTDDANASEQQGAGQPSEEELRAYLEQLRTAPVGQVMSDVLSSVLTAAQAKLGRRDARLMIDVSALIFDQARAQLPEQSVTQIEQLISQLRLGQVQAEQNVAQKGEDEPNDLAETPAPPREPSTSSSSPEPPQQQQSRSSQASKLWVPGR